jgi:hypothetical protein
MVVVTDNERGTAPWWRDDPALSPATPALAVVPAAGGCPAAGAAELPVLALPALATLGVAPSPGAVA